METRDPVKHREYCKNRNKVRSKTRMIQKDAEKGIARDAKSIPKKFWRFVKSKMKTTTGIADLQAPEGLATTDETKPCTL